MERSPAHPARPVIDAEIARHRLKERGLRPTRQRELVYRTLAATDAHPTADELLSAVRLADPGVSQATVYNTLDALTTSGLARRLPPRAPGGPCRFDADLRLHVHLTLPDGRVVDAPEPVSRSILRALSAPGLGLSPEHVAGVHIDLNPC